MDNKRFWYSCLLVILSVCLVLFYIVILSKTSFFIRAQYKVNDTLFSYRSSRLAHFLDKIIPPKPVVPPKEIVVIGVDDESMRRLDRSWPWSREIFAAFLEQIRPLKPKVVAFDFLFSKKSHSEEADRWFADEIAKRGNVILASYFDHNSPIPQHFYLPDESFLRAAKATGFIDVPYDLDGTVRRSSMLAELPGKQNFVYSMPVQIACAYQNLSPKNTVALRDNKAILQLPSKEQPLVLEKRIVPLDRKQHIPISFRYPMEQISYIPFWKIIAGKVESSKIEGKIVLVGMTSDILRNNHLTPTGIMPDVFIIAQQTLMILEQDFVKKLWPEHHWIFLLILTAIFTIIFFRLHYLYRLLVLLVAEFIIYEFAVWLFQSQRLIFSLFPTMLALLLAYLAVLLPKGVMILFESTMLHKMILIDSLTGLYNHAYVSRRLKVEFDHCRQTNLELCFVMIDVDFFKKVNDTYGHEQGNQVLIKIAETLKNGIRRGDVAARYGGEEFSIILFDCDSTAASQILDKISRLIEETTFSAPKGNFNVTISAGICSSNEDGLHRADDIIRFADESLYRAKAEGRNRTCIYRPPLQRFIYTSS